MEKKITGIEMIASEREDQLSKHKRTIDHDVRNNSEGQLMAAAKTLLTAYPEDISIRNVPTGWDKLTFMKIAIKPLKERLVIVGALIAAEIDRLEARDAEKRDFN